MSGDLAAMLVLAAVLAATMAGVSFYIYYGRLIMQSRVSGSPVGFRRMLGMTLAGLNAHALVSTYLQARRAGLVVTLDELEFHARGKGDPRDVVRRLRAAKHAETETGDPHAAQRST